MILRMTDEDVELLIEALAAAASRHEAQARVVKFGRHHDIAARDMRVLRLQLCRARQPLVTKDRPEGAQ